MTELGAAERFLADKVEEDISKCIRSAENLVKSFSEMGEINFEEIVIDADAKELLVSFAPAIEQLSQRLSESLMIPLLGSAMLRIRNNKTG